MINSIQRKKYAKSLYRKNYTHISVRHLDSNPRTYKIKTHDGLEP